MKTTLFVLKPGFPDREAIYFCPYSAQVIGYLTYYPQVRDGIDIIALDFPKPREPLATILGAAKQSAPMLVLGDDEPASVEGVTIAIANGHRFVEKTIEILRFLAHTRGTPIPH